MEKEKVESKNIECTIYGYVYDKTKINMEKINEQFATECDW